MHTPSFFSPKVDKYFYRWIIIDTWYSMEFEDMKRFYKFIHSIRRFSQKRYSQQYIKQCIHNAALFHNTNFDKKYLEEKSKELSVIAIHCLDCLNTGINPPYEDT